MWQLQSCLGRLETPRAYDSPAGRDRPSALESAAIQRCHEHRCIGLLFADLYLARLPSFGHDRPMSFSDDPQINLPMPGEPLYERLAEHYRRIIAAGTLAPG